MSTQVDVGKLADQVDKYGYAYVMTVGDSGRVHAVAVHPSVSDGVVVVAEAGGRTLRNAAARPAISLVWPPAADGGYSLIVDGDSLQDGGILRITPTRAVLHRAATPVLVGAAAVDDDACRADCIEL
ncbi:hypothetical protein GCM10027052_09820 [Parafrigoribacterium mesophilum]|uniref:hypothetical protein n=1 Tax=Parafrigoribacterium mesophilum TaxID=433646 RepID=UPI0031FD07D1